MPETLTGWVHQIRNYCESTGTIKSQRQIKNLAAIIHQRAESMQVVDADDLIRSVICYSDPTGETAVRHLMGSAA